MFLFLTFRWSESTSFFRDLNDSTRTAEKTDKKFEISKEIANYYDFKHNVTSQKKVIKPKSEVRQNI